jgi:hypothetical protein
MMGRDAPATDRGTSCQVKEDQMSEPSQSDRTVTRALYPQDEAGFASWVIVGLFAFAVIGLAFSSITSSRSDRTAIAASRTGEAPMIGGPALFEDETTGQAPRDAR